MTISEIDVHSLRDRLDGAAGVVLIDVREDDEWADGHVPGAVHVPLGTVPDRLDEFAGSPTYVMCKAGGRSMRACEFAAQRDIEVVNVTGGFTAWGAAGFDVEHGA